MTPIDHQTELVDNLWSRIEDLEAAARDYGALRQSIAHDISLMAHELLRAEHEPHPTAVPWEDEDQPAKAAPWAPPSILKSSDVARILGIQEDSVRLMRKENRGPKFTLIPGDTPYHNRYEYRLRDVLIWLAVHREDRYEWVHKNYDLREHAW